MSTLYQNTVEGFLQETVKPGEIHLLVEGSLDGLASWNNILEKWSWNTGSWYHSGNEVDATGDWISSSSLQANTGNLKKGARIKGIAISAFASGSDQKKLKALKECDRIKMTVDIGDQRQSLNLEVLSRRLENGFVFLEVNEPLLPLTSSSVDIYFKYSGSDNYRGYTCYPTGGQDVTINLYPYTPPVESEEYNPIQNNVILNEEGTIARLVEPFELRNILISPGVREHIYDGWFSPWTSSESASINPEGYEQRLDASSSYTGSYLPGTVSRPTDGGTISDAGGALGIYKLLPLAYLEKATGMACIPDSFYSSIANGSGRWLGTKNAEYHIYLGNKLLFTYKNIEECEQDIQQNVEKGIYLVNQDAPFVLKADDEPISTGLNGILRGTVQNSSNLAGEVRGEISGSLSGYVTGIGLTSESLTHYSGSVEAVDHSIWTVPGTTASIVGTGHLFCSSWKKFESLGVEPIISGSHTNLAGLTRFKGQCDLTNYTASNQTIELTYSSASGDVESWGILEGSGETYIADKSQGQFSLENVQLSGSGLQTWDVTSGNLRVVPVQSVYVSGTAGDTAETLSLNTFNGTIDVNNGVTQNIAFDHGDADGVVLSNVETVEQTTTVFDAFSADVITLVPDFGGKAGFTLTGGKVNTVSDGIMYVSLLTEDQEIIDETETGSLPSQVSLFLQGSQEPYPTAPVWRFSQVRDEIVADSGSGPRDSLVGGTAILSGSFRDFTVRGTSKDLKISRYIQVSGSKVPQADIQQAVKMLADLEAGSAFARAALARSGSEASSITPNLVSKATLPQQVYDTMMTASVYVVPGTVGPVWEISGSVPKGYVAPEFNFFGTGSEDLAKIQRFITGSDEAIERLNDYLSGSALLDSGFEHLFDKGGGQSTYVYLLSNGIDYLQVNLQDFSGQCIDRNGVVTVSDSVRPVSGSFRQIWGRFGEGTIARGDVTVGSGSLVIEGDLADVMAKDRRAVGISGVIYGAFDFAGYVNGGYEGNMVEGTIEGDMSGVISGIIETGSIEGGPAQLQGVTRGAFNGSVKAGTFRGVMQDVTISGNNLTNNLTFEGQIKSVEEFPLAGTLTGSVESVTLPDQCQYTLTASSIRPGQAILHIPDQSRMTGQLVFDQDSSIESGSDGRIISLDLTGESINLDTYTIGSVSGELEFGPEGRISLPGTAEIITPGGGWEESGSLNSSSFSGKFNISGNITVTTPFDSPFTGEISEVPVVQQVSGTFDAQVQSETYVDVTMSGSLDNFTGHALAQGLVTIRSGSKGNLVEAHDRPFFTLQEFSGSIFPEDTTLEAIQNMNISDMVLENLEFTSGMSLLSYSTGSFGEVKEQEYVQNTLTLPRVGDILYTGGDTRARVVSSKVYCPDLNAVLTVNDRGTVIVEDRLVQVQ